MPGYETRKLSVQVGRREFRVRALSDHMQFADPGGVAERAGISSATWSLFGQLWPASQVLAKAVKKVEIKGRRTLELGCGLGLPSLVLKQRGADITASDHHPLASSFLNYNVTLNKLTPISYIDLPWGSVSNEHGHFDLLIASDVLYERNHAALLAQLIGRLANPRAKVMISCPGRGYGNQFSRALESLGFKLTEKRKRFAEDELPPFRGRLLRYQREA